MSEHGTRYPDDLGVPREPRELSARCAELAGRLVKQGAALRELEAKVDMLREALGALGVIGDGYCFCSEHRDPHKERHEPECRQASAALQEGE